MLTEKNNYVLLERLRNKYLFIWTKLFANQFIPNLKQPSDPLSPSRTNRSKINFKPLYAHGRFDTKKLPCSQKLYRKIIHFTQKKYLYAQIGPNPKLKKEMCVKKMNQVMSPSGF